MTIMRASRSLSDDPLCGFLLFPHPEELQLSLTSLVHRAPEEGPEATALLSRASPASLS